MLPAILRLNMIPHLNIIEDAVFLGLGQLKGDYKIKLKGSAQPFALSVPRRVALPLRSKVKDGGDGGHSLCRGTVQVWFLLLNQQENCAFVWI